MKLSHRILLWWGSFLLGGENMKFSADCMMCLLNKEMKRLVECPEGKKLDYMKQVLKVLGEDLETAPEYQYALDVLHKKYGGELFDIYELPKKEHTRLMLLEEQRFETMVLQDKEPLKLAIKVAGAGNYIDMAAMENLEIPDLLSCIQTYIDADVDKNTYQSFYEDLKQAKELVYLTDNCGEVVLDKIFIRQIKREFPHLSMCAIVKGKPVFNDVTVEDAKYAGLDSCISLMDNGIGIAGTCLHEISDETKKKIEEADIIISKGQGNFETLSGCGLNIYYLFLCKCDLFVQLMNAKKMERIFVNERNL